jgi:hypothetical protein
METSPVSSREVIEMVDFARDDAIAGLGFERHGTKAVDFEEIVCTHALQAHRDGQEVRWTT